jgi:RNA polymerase sigma factor (sigma-70 family)
MASTQEPVIFQHLRNLAAAQGSSQQSDRQLLQQFIANRDEAAFALLVQRHGAMVLAISRSVLRHHQDAEDVFQAAFLVLARKANTIQKQDALGSWLHGVAYRLALKVKVQGARRRDREQAASDPSSTCANDDLALLELRAILHEEVHRLAEKYRASLLLCYWEGKTRDEAAEQLGMSSGAFKKCLERARSLLGSRLIRRGLAPSSAFLATLFTENGAQAILPRGLTKTTAQASAAFATGNTAVGSAAAVALAEGVIYTMKLTKWTMTLLALLLLSGVGTGLGLGAYHLLEGEPGESRGNAVGGTNLQTVGARAKESVGEKTDKERIVGVWHILKLQGNGEDLLPVNLLPLGRITFAKDGKFTMSVIDDLKKGNYSLVGSGKVDLDLAMGKSDVALGIYAFDGNDRLNICVSNERKDRPTEFKADKGTGNIVFSLSRCKPGEEKPSPEEIAKNKPVIDKLKGGAAIEVSANNLRQIALAMHNFHDQSRSFPTHAIYSKDGKTPLLSWRVAILPYIEQSKLYEEFKLDEPWDSAHNKKLIPRMPKLYAMPGVKDGETYYQVVTGPGTLFDGSKKMKLNDITDGASNTFLVVEAKTSVTWSRPDDLQLPKNKETRLPVGGIFSEGFNVSLCDGSVQFLPHTTPADKLRALVTPAAGD